MVAANPASGVVGDVLSPSIMLGGGLMATGLVREAFFYSAILTSELYS